MYSLTTRRLNILESYRYNGERLIEYAVVYQLFINESRCLGNTLHVGRKKL